ncbi:5-(carboxyamino)imidazole ribonucleotide synthase [Anaerobacillus alkalilacustris]|uniref:N5-carboxyaminoimidazole ribonucleotide synthase n=1 Tax=Anaerobacillus alkalilacustris TaxID=393763 RepID=A0A1S2LND6_9BACI|nr:5-(carboxyamino)imidazole ribonucleotide synthase [Anaerobacillus alkalilacustris]OIJ13710.1 5-(carboxyamino)imidazole ribonucleotide synthase [Anaerobacillus alkalilacustris]
MILPGSTIGILGGGQLGRMMAISAREMGYGIAVLEPNENSPCGQISDLEILTAYDDLAGAKQLLDNCDVLTYEFENIDSYTANWLEQNGNLPQGSNLLSTTQHRGKEKKAIEATGVKVAPYHLIMTKEDLLEGVKKLGIPAVLKTCRGGYDGKGQFVIRKTEDIEKAYKELSTRGELVLEKWITFEKELSVIVSRNKAGESKTFPVTENIHENNILHMSIVPARVTEETIGKAEQVALHLARSFELVGTLAVEMFLTPTGEIYVNELAPRPHNSGHYTINACETSQFDQHIRAICNWPLGNTNLLKPAVMVNILGEHIPQVLQSVPNMEQCHLHLYGKEEAKQGRKMGHLTVLGTTIDEAMKIVEALQIWNEEKMGV